MPTMWTSAYPSGTEGLIPNPPPTTDCWGGWEVGWFYFLIMEIIEMHKGE